ncbi:MAG: hypothetical protein MJ132_00320 [Clostridia bacterium]|nr:hypothetical protein [Clostridia bacterium]
MKTRKLLAYLLAFTLAFTCFVCVPMVTSAATVTVNTASELADALANTSYDHIIIGSSISSTTGLTINRSLTLEGAAGVDGYHIDGANLAISGGNVVLKNLKLTRNADTVTIKNTTNVTISGGEIYCTNTGNGNEGAIYVNALNGTVTLTDGVVIKSKNWAVYDDNGSSNQYTGTVNFVDCLVQKVSGNSYQKDLLAQRNATTYNIGGGTDGQQAIFEQSSGKIWTADKNHDKQKAKAGEHLNIYDGAVFNLPGEDWGFYVNANSIEVNVYGGEFNFGGQVFYINQSYDAVNISGGTFNIKSNVINVNDTNSGATISGGTFNGVGNCEKIVMKNNGALTITGGEFNNPYGVGVLSASGKGNGALNVSNATFETAGPAISISGNITANITSGTFTSTGTDDRNGTGVITAKTGTVTISGGEFTQTGDSAHSVIEVNSGASTCTLKVTDGTFTHENKGAVVYTAPDASAANVTVTGGTQKTDLIIGKQTKNGSTRLVMKLTDDAETIEAYETLGFKLVIDGEEQIVNVDCVYDSFYNGGTLVTAESLGCTYVAIYEIGSISEATSVTAQGVINDTVTGAVKTLK